MKTIKADERSCDNSPCPDTKELTLMEPLSGSWRVNEKYSSSNDSYNIRLDRKKGKKADRPNPECRPWKVVSNRVYLIF
jgi:hypothetical protein